MKDWFKARNIWGAAIQTLSDAEAGRLMKAIWSYTMTGEQQNLSGAERGIFALILMTLSQDEEQAIDLSRKRAEAGAIGGRQRQANQAIANFAINEIANQANASNKNKSKNIETEKEKEVKENLFSRFWESYPRHENKPAAKKAFERLKPDEDLLQIMLTAIERQKSSAQWQEDGGHYIPHPATWLNGRRWEDELQVSTKGRTVSAQEYTQRDYSGEQEEAVHRMLSMMGGADSA